ncbi:tRNA-splicing endonuclease subunit Sen54 [Gouania willdenowi]|uniref:tRNA-splicing endonuclease subunit Sen54 N-terminal domain-containing protein n=1 Tax=Gouania willdenowi TaxID=441366 RepID=A0A8C5EHK7_GOUWI|nr:tRNA-splicing endonuclease subunit Sen54 [Gouania willdenowi]
MADQNKPNVDEEFYNEVLSPTQLFAARSRTHKIPVRGQKDFVPDESEDQQQRLEQSLREHWSLLSEERVERTGNLVKALWIPEDHVVELQSPAGKFWQTMGFSSEGRQFLHPEEALYLMECGNVQVFYQDLPFSIQDGYEHFLSSSSVSLQQYQVFGHLKRLGYVVLRFDSSSETTSYVRRLNLPSARERAAKQLKRKRSPSPEEASTSQTCSHVKSHTEESGKDGNLPDVPLREISEDQTTSMSPAEEGRVRSWWTPHPPMDSDHGRPYSSSSRWDFSSIWFPDVGSGGAQQEAPDPSLLPGSVSVGYCDTAPWSQRVNLRAVKMSPKEQRTEPKDVNEDMEVRRCRNWSEYEALRSRRASEREQQAADHLWSGEVTPLHDPHQPISTVELLEKISIIRSTDLLQDTSSLQPWPPWTITFNVYQPDTVCDFKKSRPGKPHCRMCVCSFDDPVPDLRALKVLSRQSGEDVPVVVAVVDYGDISFYTFKDFHLPRDVFS